jgi:tetratricopeptide (TPR) repeat protein
MKTKERVLLHKGIDSVRRGRYAEAIEFYDRVLASSPESTETWNNKGVALYKLGRVEEALECYDRSLSIEPQNLDALRNKGFVFCSLERLEEALECYDRVLEAGGDAEDLEARATVLVGMGRLQEALSCLMEAVKRKPLERFEEEIEILHSMLAQSDSKRE